MNKTELVETVSANADLSKAAAARAVEAVLGAITKTVAKGGAVQLIGFGTFSAGKRAARTGRNPQTGEALKIPAAKTVKFAAGKGFKDLVNKKK